MAHRTQFPGAQRAAVKCFRLIVVLTFLYEVTSFQVHAPHQPGCAKKIAGSSIQGPLFTINMCTMQQGGQGVALRKVDLPGFDTWMKDRKIKAQKVSHAMFEAGDTEQRGLVACKDLAEVHISKRRNNPHKQTQWENLKRTLRRVTEYNINPLTMTNHDPADYREKPSLRCRATLPYVCFAARNPPPPISLPSGTPISNGTSDSAQSCSSSGTRAQAVLSAVI